MKIHDIDENLSLYNQIYPSHKNVLPWWKFKDEFSLLINFYPYGKLFFIMSAWWIFFTLIKIHHFVIFFPLWWKSFTFPNIHLFDENSPLGKKIHHNDGNYSFWWKFTTFMKIHHSDEHLSLWWKLFLKYLFDEHWLRSWKFVNIIFLTYELWSLKW